MSKSFLQKFNKFNPTKQNMKTLDRLKDYRLIIDRENQVVQCIADFTEFIRQEDLLEIEEGIKNAYELKDCMIYPKYESVLFRAEYTYDLFILMNAHYKSSIGKSYITGHESLYDEEIRLLTVTLRQGLNPGLLYDSGVDEFIKSAVKDQFSLDIDIKFMGEVDISGVNEKEKRLKEEAQVQYERFEQEKQKNVEMAPESVASLDPMAEGEEFSRDENDEFIISSGRFTFDISEPEPVYGRISGRNLVPVRKITNGKKASFLCRMFMVEEKENRDYTRTNYKLYVTDLDSSVIVRFGCETTDTVKLPKPPCYLMIEGTPNHDKFDNETVVRATGISVVKRVMKEDTAQEKRVELHMHTNMSTVDAMNLPGEIMRTASEWGMPAVAFTDHGNVQSYPEIMKARKKYKDVKPIYGMEGYLVDDTARAVFNLKPEDNLRFKEDVFVIFDIETTGLSASTCGITEIGAVKYRGGEVIDVFETFVNPGMHIPDNIVKLTGITDEMVAGAPKPKEAVKNFLDFAGGGMLIAHNATFDISFIRKTASDYKLKFNNAYLDTLSLSRYLNRDLSRHGLDSLRKYFNLGEFNHHRASDDCRMLADVFDCMVRKLEPDGIKNISELINEMAANADPRKLKPYHVTILVKNQTGLKNLYKMISNSYINYFYRYPRLPKTMVNENREGLLIGSACEAGEIYQMILEERPYADQYKAAEFYDYFEIMPHCNNMFLVDENKVAGVEALEKINRRILEIGDKQKKPVVATGDAHFLEKDDEIYRQIMQFGQKYSNAFRTTGLYFKTTDEMLEEFKYLGSRTHEVVVDNTRKIADMIDGDIKPIPDGTYTPEIEGAEDELISCCYEEAKTLYGDPLPEEVKTRMEKELDSIIKNGFAVLYVIARKLVKKSEESGYLVGSRGSVGSSFIATLCGVSEVNPLPPHRRCPKCKHTVFYDDGSVGGGFDLEDAVCEACGTKTVADGHDIPFETFLGFDGDKAPDIDLNFSGRVQLDAHKYTETLFGKENIFRAGTVSTIASKTAYGFVRKYLEEKNLELTKAEINRLTAGCTGIKRTTGQHPGGIVVIPKQYEIYDFTPVQHPADKESSGVVTTHFAFEYLHDTLLKLDILGHDVPTFYKVLEEYTGIDVRTIPMNDKRVMSLFTSPEELGVSEKRIGLNTGTLGLPEFGTSYVREMLITAKPRKFSDLVQISGLSHGTGIWLGNGEQLIKENICTIDTVIGTRDSIMTYLMHQGVPSAPAFKIMEMVRKGKGVSPDLEEIMNKYDIPEWYIDSCKKIKYMFPKAHAAAYVISAIRLGWYKIYKPIEFYAAYFTVKPGGFDSALVLRDKRGVEALIREYEAPDRVLTQKEEETLTALQMVNEMYARDIYFLPVDIYKSRTFDFVIEDGKIRMPLTALNGLGETAAEKINAAIINGEATTFDELITVAGLNKTVVEILKSNDSLGGMPQSNQLTLF